MNIELMEETSASIAISSGLGALSLRKKIRGVMNEFDLDDAMDAGKSILSNLKDKAGDVGDAASKLGKKVAKNAAGKAADAQEYVEDNKGKVAAGAGGVAAGGAAALLARKRK